MPISTSKLTTLGQLKLQAERIKQELASYVLASSLGSLATKSEISETELSEALKSVINGKMDATSSMTTQQINQAISQAIASSQHAKFEKVETVPTTETAEENVLYLVMNSETEFYDIYALVSGEVVRLDDTSVDLSAVGGSLYEGTKDSLETSDTSVIEAYFEENSTTTPKKGDVFVITTVISGVEYEQSAYYYDGDSWVAMTGNVDADKVIMREDITMAGNYTQVGNLTKGQNATGTLASKGKSIAEVLTEILSKRLQPTITAQPSISGFALSGAKAVEAGTKLASVNYTAGTLNPGSYQYGPETGVVASNWVVQRITDLSTEQISGVNAASLSAGSDDNDGDGFTIGDVGGENVFASLKYKAVATHGAGVTAKDNLGDDSNPPVSIASGEKEKATSAYTPYRNYFSGATTSKPTLDSAYIRGLTKSNKPYAAGTLTINVAAGTQRVCIACLASKTGVTKVINETAMNADVTSTFTQSTVDVEGAEGYTAQSYKVWVFEPAVPYENAAVLKVTLG